MAFRGAPWRAQVDFLRNVNSSRDVGVLQAMDKRAKLELQLWASYRAQTLARTVRGIMYYDQAIRMLAVVSVVNFLYCTVLCRCTGVNRMRDEAFGIMTIKA